MNMSMKEPRKEKNENRDYTVNCDYTENRDYTENCDYTENRKHAGNHEHSESGQYSGRFPRLLLCAGASGSGKTLITCGLLQVLRKRYLKPVSFKCGPDYIDPLFHETVLGIPSRNLDTFFTDSETTRYLFCRNASGADISVIEGVMGYYDGLAGTSLKASSYDVARVTRTPAVLIVDCRGMSLSMVPIIQGFLRYREPSCIQGVILNRVPSMLYSVMKARIERELGIKVYGYVPVLHDFTLESRHLGLVLPNEIDGLRENIQKLACELEKTLDVDRLLDLAQSAPPLCASVPVDIPCIEGDAGAAGTPRPRIAVARDEAFCFLYADNLALLEMCGAVPFFFSPLHDKALPAADGLLLPGGYPELHAEALSSNTSMLASIRGSLKDGLPCMAECGGFMYLQQEMEDMEGISWPMACVLPGKAFQTSRSQRFGYISLESVKEQMLGDIKGELKGHEFHYYDCTHNGTSFLAKKPVRDKSWYCIEGTGTMIAGFPHLYYWSCPKAAAAFVRTCAGRIKKR